ncbi:MAG: hypothetical protein ACI81F_002250, partial [Thalassolituus oleivorans]
MNNQFAIEWTDCLLLSSSVPLLSSALLLVI